MTKKRIGRPPKLTPEVQAKIEQALRAGNYREVAARFAGVSSPTLKAWYAEGKKQSDKGRSSKFKDFYAAVNKAEADAETLVVGRLMAAAAHDVKAMAFWLERKHSQRWGRKDTLNAKVDANVKSGVPALSELSAEDLVALARAAKP